MPENAEKKAEKPAPQVRFISSATDGRWRRLDKLEESLDPSPAETTSLKVSEDGARSTLHSFFFDCLSATNLVVLSGSGTSLALNSQPNPPAKRAPSMADLWRVAKERTGEAFDDAVEISRYEGEENIEGLLSRCKTALAHLGTDKDGQKIESFIKTVEGIIVELCSFVDDKTNLDVHKNFLQRIARRSARKQRTKIFTTNYDICFEEAAARRRFLVIDGFSFASEPEFDPIHFEYDIVRRTKPEDGPDYVENVFYLYK